MAGAEAESFLPPVPQLPPEPPLSRGHLPSPVARRTSAVHRARRRPAVALAPVAAPAPADALAPPQLLPPKPSRQLPLAHLDGSSLSRTSRARAPPPTASCTKGKRSEGQLQQKRTHVPEKKNDERRKSSVSFNPKWPK